MPIDLNAQRIENVSGEYTYIVRDNDNITLGEAKRKCIEFAKAAAIKEVFGELITSDVIDTYSNTDGESSSSYYWENTVAMAKGKWIGDTEEPVLDVNYKDGQLVFTAKVHGDVSEISQVTTELKWNIKKDGINDKTITDLFDSGDHFYVGFRSPADGYVAIYLTVGDDETFCLLPYSKDSDGRFPVKANRDYEFFDKSADPSADQYLLKTKRIQEDNQLIIIYSPNRFTKCNDVSRDSRHPNSLTTHEFQRWLLKCQREDSDMVVNKKWIRINNKDKQQ